MRPDQHKQKRSAQYKRQQAIKGAVSAGGGPQGGPATRRQPKTQHDRTDVAARDAGGGAKGKTSSTDFARRPKTDNWDRFEDPEAEQSEEEDGADFGSIVKEAAGSESSLTYFQFSDDVAAAKSADSLGLTVDLGHVRDLLQAIPLHERVGVPRQFLRLSTVERNEKLARAAAEKLALKATKEHDDAQGKQGGELEVAIEAGTPLVRAVEVDGPTSAPVTEPASAAVPHKVAEEEEEEELDFLLRLSSQVGPLARHHQVNEPSGMEAEAERPTIASTTVPSQSRSAATAVGHPPAAASVGGTKGPLAAQTAEDSGSDLEGWLDTVL